MNEAIFILLTIASGVLILPIVALVKSSNATRAARDAEKRVRRLESRLEDLEDAIHALKFDASSATPPLEEKSPHSVTNAHLAPAAKAVPVPTVEDTPVPTVIPVVPPTPSSLPEPAIAAKNPPPPLPATAAPRALAPLTEPKPNKVSLEQFMGVKLFAWLGGIAMFLGVIFFVKYAFEKNLIPPAIRVALGFLTGAAFLAGGLWTQRKRNYQVLAQSLCATGILILYGVSFAAHAVYHFAAFSPPITFALMTLITAAGFLIAVRFDALIVAVMGMIGGFLSPLLLPSVQDNVFALFSYIALLDVGLLLVARHRNWTFLTIAAALGTALMQIGWFSKFFHSGRYFEGSATLVPIGVFLIFVGLFVLATWWTRKTRPEDRLPAAAALGMTALAMLFAFVFLSYSSISGRPFLLYGFVLTLNIAALAIGAMTPMLRAIPVGAALITFLHLATWTMSDLTPELLGSALSLYLLFGGLSAIYPSIHARLNLGQLDPVTSNTSPWFTPLGLALMLLTVLVLPEVSLLVWPAILIADLIIIALAFRSGLIGPVIAALVLTVTVGVAWLFQGPPVIDSLLPLLLVVVIFGALFAVAGLWLGKRCLSKSTATETTDLPTWLTPGTLLPVLSGALPFILLVLTLLVLPVANPTPVFGVAMLLGILLLGISIPGRLPLLAPVALLCTLIVEGAWHLQHFNPDEPGIALTWYLTFYAIFTAFPFVFRKTCRKSIGPWAASALSGIGHFFLLHDLIAQAFPNDMMGLIPAAFAIPTIGALLAVLNTTRAMDDTHKSQLAWFGGVALLFITLIFPIQFDRQWLTVSWAMEGAAVLWLFRRVPHNGLKWTGLALLGIAFARLAMNPAVLSSYPRSGNAILNWHLYAFGLVAVAQFLGGWWLPENHRKIQDTNLPAILYGFAGVLLFFLLNIEIADFFSEPGERFIAFRFGGNFARDMTYSIAWGLFSLALLGLGIWFRARPLRYTAIGLLGITLLKVFVHDLSAIDNIYRIGALIGVAIIAFIASFLYQQFFNRSEQRKGEGEDPPTHS
jgi:hypothetical protein